MFIARMNLLTVIVLIFSFLSCDDEPSGSSLKGSATVEITDAPADDPNISAVLVTVADVKVDGQSLEGFSKTTIDISALQNGNTQMLGELDLDAKNYNSISLILDYEQDENGNSPGCYVMDAQGEKQPLRSDDDELTLSGAFDVAVNTTTKLLVDFDLRKSIKRENNGNDRYDFVGKSELQSRLRLVAKNETGTLQGNCNTLMSDNDKIVAFAYRKGTYNRETEVQSNDDIRFKGAVSSATVANNGDFSLHFLESGEYEIHFAAYDYNDNTQQSELKGTLLVNALTSLDLLGIQVDAQASVSANVIVTGIIPL
jgi:hypothetical protein